MSKQTKRKENSSNKKSIKRKEIIHSDEDEDDMIQQAEKLIPIHDSNTISFNSRDNHKRAKIDTLSSSNKKEIPVSVSPVPLKETDLNKVNIPAFKNVRMLKTVAFEKDQHPVITNLLCALNNGIFPPTVAGTSSDIINRNEQDTKKIKVTHEIIQSPKKELNKMTKPQRANKMLTLDQILNKMEI